MGYDPEKGFTSDNVDPSWMSFLTQLQENGVDAALIAENMDFIKNFVRDAQKPKPATNTATTTTKRTNSSTNASAAAAAAAAANAKSASPPAPPTPRRKTTQKGSKTLQVARQNRLRDREHDK